MKRKSIGIGITVILFLSCFMRSASAESYTSKNLDNYFRVNEHTPYVSGYGNHTFGPNNSITRAEVAQMLYNLLIDPAHSPKSHFSDVPLEKWYGQAVNALTQIGVFHGYGDGTFRPNSPITRAELVAALTSCVPSVSADNPFSDVSTSYWAYKAIITAAANNWISGYPDGTFQPKRTITRAETVAILNRALDRTGEGFAENRTGGYFTDIQENNWAYLDIVEASGAVAYKPTPSSNPDITYPQVKVTVASLNMRSGPGTNYSVIMTLGKNILLDLIDKAQDPWLHVKTQDGTEGYVHANYVSEYVPNTTPASRINLSLSSVKLAQYKSLRLDGISTPRTTLVWSSSNESIVTLSTIRYGEGDESCFIYGKAPGSATVYCSDYAGNIQVKCSVTVQAAEPVRYAFTEPNLVTTKDSAKLVAVTGPQETAVRFAVEDSLGNNVLSRDIRGPSVERYGNNVTNVFQCPIDTLSAGEYWVKVSSADTSGKFTSADGFSFTVHTPETSSATTDNDRDISDTMIKLIMEYEDYVPIIRDDSSAPKNPTVGYGFVVNTNKSFYNNMTQREAKALLIEEIRSDYGEAVNNFQKRNNLRMSQNQYDALVSFAYNLGPGYMNNPSGNRLFTSIINAVVPPSNISTNNPCPAVLNAADAPLYARPARGAQSKKTITKGTALQVIDVQRNAASKELWYMVKAGSDTGWMRAGNIKLNLASAVHDLNYVDSMTFSTYILTYHHADDICIPGLLYRRLREAKLFIYADYKQASSDSIYYTKNTYHFIYPDCMKAYE